jgi:multidrug efflux pump subunit AcrA (membrane-fusion protein)
MKLINLMIILIIVLMVFSFLVGCGSAPQEKPGENAVPVKIVAVSRQPLAIPIFTSGTLFPGSMIKLSFKIGGIVDQLRVDEGDTVKRGQLLASLNLAEIAARHQQARSAWLKAQRDAERVKNLYGQKGARQECKNVYDNLEDKLLTDFLASFTLIPGTVVHLGYGSLYLGNRWQDGAWVPGAGDLMKMREGLFFKASYLWRIKK